MKLKIVLFYLLLLSFIGGWLFFRFPNKPVFASPPAPTPKCYIKGIIQDVRFEKAYENPCVKNNSCPTDVQLSYPDTYYLSVKIQNISFKEGETRFQTCDSLYPHDSTQEIFVIKDRVKMGDSFSNNQSIEGTVSSFWGKSFDSYNISASLINNPEKSSIGQLSPSVFDNIKLIFSRILNLISGITKKVNGFFE